jgi:uncharacterized protein YbjT (DUF2867 family)
MNKTAVVFGATGMVGREIVNELCDSHEYSKVIAVVRSTLLISNVKLEQLQIIDYSELGQYKSQLNASTYFCCIGTTIKIAGSQEAFRRVDHDIPQQIAQLAQELSVASLVVISSIGARADAANFYLRTKGEMENSISKTYSGNLKIVRPSLLMGNHTEFRFAEKFSTVFMKVLGWLFVGSAKKYRGIYAGDVAKAMIKAVRLPADKVIIESDELQDLASG